MCHRVGSFGFESQETVLCELTAEEAAAHEQLPDDGVSEVWTTCPVEGPTVFSLVCFKTPAHRETFRRAITGALLTPAELRHLNVNPADYLAALECSHPDTCEYRRSIANMLH